MNGLGHRIISTRRKKIKTPQQLCIVTWKVLSAWGINFASNEPCYFTWVPCTGAALRTELVRLKNAKTSTVGI